MATDLGLKQVPVVIEEPKADMDRLVQQFHIQEQNQGWTATEKASVVTKLCREFKLSFKEVCDLLSIDKATSSRYLAFADILDKKNFQKNDIGINWAEPINALKRLSKRLYMETLDEEFTREMEKELESAIILRIKDGQFKTPSHLTKVKDSFVKDPKSISQFINTNVTAESLFLKTKAKGAHHLRNIINNATYLNQHLSSFLKIQDTKITEHQIVLLKNANQNLKKLLDKVSE